MSSTSSGNHTIGQWENINKRITTNVGRGPVPERSRSQAQLQAGASSSLAEPNYQARFAATGPKRFEAPSDRPSNSLSTLLSPPHPPLPAQSGSNSTAGMDTFGSYRAVAAALAIVTLLAISPPTAGGATSICPASATATSCYQGPSRARLPWWHHTKAAPRARTSPSSSQPTARLLSPCGSA